MILLYSVVVIKTVQIARVRLFKNVLPEGISAHKVLSDTFSTLNCSNRNSTIERNTNRNLTLFFYLLLLLLLPLASTKQQQERSRYQNRSFYTDGRYHSTPETYLSCWNRLVIGRERSVVDFFFIIFILIHHHHVHWDGDSCLVVGRFDPLFRVMILHHTHPPLYKHYDVLFWSKVMKICFF